MGNTGINSYNYYESDIIRDTVIAGGTIYGVYVVVKWVIAGILAPETGGASLGLAAATP